MAVSLLNTLLGNARYADLVPFSETTTQTQLPSGSFGLSRGRAGSSSSVGSSQIRASRPTIDTFSEHSNTNGGAPPYQTPVFAHLDGADVFHGDESGGITWNLFAEMLRSDLPCQSVTAGPN